MLQISRNVAGAPYKRHHLESEQDTWNWMLLSLSKLFLGNFPWPSAELKGCQEVVISLNQFFNPWHRIGIKLCLGTFFFGTSTTELHPSLQDGSITSVVSISTSCSSSGTSLTGTLQVSLMSCCIGESTEISCLIRYVQTCLWDEELFGDMDLQLVSLICGERT